MTAATAKGTESTIAAQWVEVVIEVPRGSFIKRDGHGKVEFLSPLPCPVNYGSVVDSRGADCDPLDAVVIGGRLARGQRVRVPVRGAVGFRDRGVDDLKLVCSFLPITALQRRRLLLFFRFYGLCKRWMQFRDPDAGPTCCDGWCQGPAVPALR